MKKSLPYEVVAAILAMLGSFVLVCVYYPILNPGQYRIDSHQETALLIQYILGTPVSLVILFAAWKLNRHAQRLKQEEKDEKHK